MIAISVIIPVYNAEKYLKQCLDSVKEQTIKNIEIICVDDGSTDCSSAILDRYAQQDKRFRIIHQKNQYAGTARNKGIKEAKGVYLSFLDADDFFELDMLEKMYYKALQTQAEIVICESGAYFDTENVFTDLGSSVKKDLFPEDTNIVNRTILPEKIFQISAGWTWDKLFLNSFIKNKNLTFQPYRTTNDALFVELALAEANKIALLPEILVYHRTRVMGSLEDSRDISWENCYYMLKELKLELLQRGIFAEVEQSFNNFALNFLIWNLTTMKTMDGYLGLYNKLKYTILPEFELYQKEPAYFYAKDLCLKLKLIKEHTAEEFLLKEIGQLHQTLDGLHQSIYSLYKTINKLDDIIKRKSWRFPYMSLKKNSSVIIYGAGEVGKDLHTQLCHSQWCKEALWVDTLFEKYQQQGLPVKSPEQIKGIDFDVILVAVIDKKIAHSISEYLKRMGIKEEKIVFYE